jgi:hypothetical protein
MDLVREILLATEDGKTTFTGGDDKNVEQHITMMERGGLIYGSGRTLWGLTWDGFNLLDTIRDKSVWEKAKATLMKEGSSWTIELLKAWVTHHLKRQLGISEAQ